MNDTSDKQPSANSSPASPIRRFSRDEIPEFYTERDAEDAREYRRQLDSKPLSKRILENIQVIGLIVGGLLIIPFALIWKLIKR